MKALIGKKLKGTVSGLNATFEVVAIKNILGESVAILECVTYGVPLIKVSISDIEKPVRAYINNAPKGARVMTNQKILDNAPDGATHVMGGNCYCMENTEYDYSEDGYDYLTFRNEDTSGRHRSLADIAKIAELENQWISVEDEMPSAEHAMVIVDFYGGNVSVGYPHKRKILDEPMGMLFNGVTHWMPLPKPPKEQGE